MGINVIDSCLGVILKDANRSFLPKLTIRNCFYKFSDRVIVIGNHAGWRWYAGTFVAVNFASCAIFALYATAPPWYAARRGLIDPFPRVLAGRAWSHVGLKFASRVIEKGQGTVNPFAAIPSLHSAQAMLVAVFCWGLVWKPLRPLLLLYPLTMAFALVYSGEHYLIDVFAGWGMVALALTIGWRIRLRRGWRSPFRWPSPAPVSLE